MRSTDPEDYKVPKPDQVGLRQFVTRMHHITINVTDLERSTRLLESVLKLRRTVRFETPVQPFTGLGIVSGRFVGWELQDTSEYPSRAIHVVEWKEPGPVGAAYPEANHVGFYRLESTMRGTGVGPALERAVELGARPYGPFAWSVLDDKGARGGPVVTVRDHDGISIEMSNDSVPGGFDRLHHVAMNCRDLGPSFAFYRDVVGLDPFWMVQPGPQDNTTIIGDRLLNTDGTAYEEATLHRDAALFRHRFDDRTPLNLVAWHRPKPYGEPYIAPNHVGIQSLAFEVDRIEDAYAALSRALVNRPDQLCGPPEIWNLGEAGEWWVVTFFDPDGARLHLVESVAARMREAAFAARLPATPPA